MNRLGVDCNGSGADASRGAAIRCHCGAAWAGRSIPRHQPGTHGYDRPTGLRQDIVKRITPAEAAGLVSTHYVAVAVRPFFDETSMTHGSWWAVALKDLPEGFAMSMTAIPHESQEEDGSEG